MVRLSLEFGMLLVVLHSQPIVPAKAGLLSYADEAFIDDKLIDEISPTHPVTVNENAVLRTNVGHAEVLLGPCSVMWVDENSSLRMISTALSDVRINVLTGTVVVAAGLVPKEMKLSVLLNTSVLSLNRLGAYRDDAAPPRVKVLAGKIDIQTPNQSMTVTVGRVAMLGAKPSVQRFDKRNSDPFEQWCKSRSAFLSRLLGQQTGPAHQPTRQLTRDDMDAVVRGFPGGARVNDPPHVPVQSMPTPNSPSSGCMMPEW